MTTSSAPLSYSITLSDTITLSNTYILSDTSTITSGTGSSYSVGSGYTIDPATFTWEKPKEFVDALPDINRIEAMCKQYPGLKIAYEKFVTTYKLVKDDYDTPEDQRPRP